MDEPRVREAASSRAVKVPEWFTVAAALKVARLKGVSHLLVLDRQRIVGSVSAQLLATAPATDPVSRWTTLCEATVEPHTSQEEATRLMALHGAECLAVVSGALLLGVVHRADLVAGGEARAAE